MSPDVRVLPDPQGVADAVARELVSASRRAIAERGHFNVALSGGSTPKLMYRTLRGMDADWAHWRVYFSDERTVGPESPDSNYHSARTELLDHVGIPPHQVFRMQGEIDPQLAAREYERVLPTVMDVTLLGMGDDGHTASLFPGTEALGAQGRVAANFVPRLDTWRITFTFGEINAAKERWVMVTGGNKAGVLREAVAGSGLHPVEGVRDPVWFVDAPAATELS